MEKMRRKKYWTPKDTGYGVKDRRWKEIEEISQLDCDPIKTTNGNARATPIDSATLEAKLDVFLRWCLRRTLRVPFSAHITNTEIYR